MNKVYILVFALLQCLLQEQPYPVHGADSGVSPASENREVLRCGEQMVRIHKAIFRFYGEKKRLPDFLSDLSPNYRQKEDFTCPAHKRVGDQAWARAYLRGAAFRDPKFDSSTYSYEFIMKMWEGTSVTYQEYKKAQRDYFGLRFGEGDAVPLLRCFLHGETNVLNVAFGGKLFKSGVEWEQKYMENYGLRHEELDPEAVLPIRVKLEGPIPARLSGLPAELLDLTQSYTALITKSWVSARSGPSPFAGLIENPRFLRNLKFDVRGVIQLKGSGLYRPFARKVEKIQVGQKAQRLRFLLGAYGKEGMGETIAQIRLNFVDRNSMTFSVEYGSDVLDWSTDPAEASGNQLGERVAWVGERQTEEGKVETVRLYEFTRENPNLEKEIASIDFEVAETGLVISKSAPALFAITLEPPK